MTKGRSDTRSSLTSTNQSNLVILHETTIAYLAPLPTAEDDRFCCVELCISESLSMIRKYIKLSCSEIAAHTSRQ